MPADPAIAAALRAAGGSVARLECSDQCIERIERDGSCREGGACICMEQAAAAIAAFLLHMHAWGDEAGMAETRLGAVHVGHLAKLAALVQEAARDA